MGLLSYLRSVYDVSTLDTRFTTPSSVPYRTLADSPGDPLATNSHAEAIKAKAEPSKWRTREFYTYYLYLAIFIIPCMWWVAYSVSRPSDPRWPKFERRLSPGWILGRKIDNTDAQYRTFRGNLPFMTLLLIFHPLARRLWNTVFPLRPAKQEPNRPAAEAAARLGQRTSFDVAFALIYLSALHGFSALKILLILYANYKLTTSLPRRYVPAATWVFNVGILFSNELCQGYKFKPIAELVTGYSAPVDLGVPEPALVRWGAWLDTHRGLLGRWEVMFNITILRLISFNMDRYWAVDRGSSNSLEKKQLDPENLSEKDRVSLPADPQDYSFRNYVAYAIYAPLYIAGPILTFNDYISQCKHRPATLETPRTLRYAARFLLTLLGMEITLHTVYVGAISLAKPDWSSYTPAQLSLLSYFNLHIIWLKLLLPWRLFRLWALVDGVDPPENMVRCVSNNYSTLFFWRAWHRSYNRWLIRYLYVPLGGARFTDLLSSVKSILTYVMVFTFVALWHDIQLRLLIWGWLIVLFLIPEITAKNLFPSRRWADRPTAFRMLCCVGSVGNVLMMMMANLVGFAVGLDGLKSIISGIFQDRFGVAFFVTACTALFVGVQIMYEIRESEKRKGINLRC